MLAFVLDRTFELYFSHQGKPTGGLMGEDARSV